MDLRRKSLWFGVALGVAIAIGAPLTAKAQNPNPEMGTKEPYTPAKDAKDLKAVLFNWMWHTGMLKGHDERDMVATLEHQAKVMDERVSFFKAGQEGSAGALEPAAPSADPVPRAARAKRSDLRISA